MSLHTIPRAIQHTSLIALTSQSWRFDITSALIGAALALLLAGLAYHFLDTLRAGGEAALSPLRQISRFLQASAGDRYLELIIARAQSLTALAPVTRLDAIFVEPDLLIPTTSEDNSASPTPTTLPLHRILGGHRQIIIAGRPGAGRTASLAYVALSCARLLKNGDETALSLGQRRLPLYVSLPAMDWLTSEPEATLNDPIGAEHVERDVDVQEQEEGNPLDRLLDAAIATIGGRGTMTKIVRQSIEAGQAIFLIDGWSALAPGQRQRAATWLSELIDSQPENVWLISTGECGYGPLTEAKFVLLTLKTWDTGQIERLVAKWTQVVSSTDLPGTDGNGKPSPTALRQLTNALHRATRAGASPFELTLRTFVYLADGRLPTQSPTKRVPVFDRALELLFQLRQEQKGAQLSATCQAVLEQIALTLLQEQRTTANRKEIEEAIQGALPSSEEKPGRALAQVFRTLTEDLDLLRPVRTDAERYAFSHALWQAYLAARRMDTLNRQDIIARLDDPTWVEALRFYAEIGDIAPLVSALLQDGDDIFYSRLRTISTWISVAPKGAAWCNGAMSILARVFLRPRLPLSIRKGLAEALAITDAPGVSYLFKQALQHNDPQIRVAAVLGLTRLAQESDLPALESALEDENPTVRETAVRELAYIDTDAVVQLLAKILLEGDEALSLIAGEALGHCGTRGAEILREATELEDVVARRAAVVGLAQMEARDALNKLAREDDQWIVRSAASAALEELEAQESITGVDPPPKVDQLPWLISWAASQGESVGLGQAALDMLQRALKEGEASVRIAAAQTLGQIGQPDAIPPLRAALASPNPSVTEAALEALAQISKRYGLKLIKPQRAGG